MLTISLIPRIGKWGEVSVYFFHLVFPVSFHTPATLVATRWVILPGLCPSHLAQVAGGSRSPEL